jgi:serine/threonine protein phosphatase 1
MVVPDIHGCAHTLQKLVHDLVMLEKSDHLYLLGDYIDRGPRSKEVIDFLFFLRREGYNIHPLRGNHEDMLVRAMVDKDALSMWLANGGSATLTSFNISEPSAIPHIYRNFFVALPYFISLQNHILVHAGLGFSGTDPFTDKEAMLWDRSHESYPRRIGGKQVVAGHTPVSQDVIHKSLQSPKIMLDNGCAYKGTTGLGTLTAYDLNNKILYFQKNVD